jgi:hypothetical protein
VAMDRELQSGIKGKIICVVYQSFLTGQKDLYSNNYLLKMCYSIVENIIGVRLFNFLCLQLPTGLGEMPSDEHKSLQ